MNKLTFSFDIGYASIGWGALKGGESPEVLGAGVVLFPKDDCLASKRRVYRRMRRAIRSRRQRIDRIGRILEHHGLITAEERQLPGHAAPFWLAARALAGKVKLSGLEVWHLMRWYAHNRGYDGNRLWSGDAADSKEDDEDTTKVEAAKANMKKFGTTTMAETVTKLLGLELEGHQASMAAYKTLDMAFPREVVRAEVCRLLGEHSELPPHVAQLIVGVVDEQREELAACGVRLPRRFSGSILFGQLVPRFDNRIIARCPITWANEYTKARNSGEEDKAARAQADKYAKVPKADSREFYEYRFARILCNIRVGNKPLDAAARVKLMEQAREVGRFTATSFKKAVKELIGDAPSNLSNFFQIHPDSDKALVVDPVKGGGTPASGRAPYARPVLRQVVEEVLRGEDPTKPARSLTHPDGEAKAQDGVLYCLLDPESEVSRLQATRRVEDMSNNHLVRHRMLIFKRLLKDMIRKYAEGDASRVGQFCIEVGRELSDFSGKTSDEIARLLGLRMKNFKDAEAKLRNEAPHLTLTAGLIRKCRIAMDLGMTCPYTGQKYGVEKLPEMEKEHIIPHASRNSNSLSSLVLTWSQVNQMKGKRTALQFVKEEAGNPVPGLENYHIITEERYREFVKKLTPKGDIAALSRKLHSARAQIVSVDDFRRRLKRKKLLLVDELQSGSAEKDNLGFTDGIMTQSSHLMKIAQHVAKGICPNARVVMIPGAVTAAVRTTWNAWGLLSRACAKEGEDYKTLHKDEIRKRTHMHHAVDACVLGLIPLLIPSGVDGFVWSVLVKRHLDSETELKLKQTLSEKEGLYIDAKHRVQLKPLPDSVLRTLILALKEERVVTHIPADMSGARFEDNIYGLKEVQGNMAILRKRQQPKGGQRGRRTEEKKLLDKLVGISPYGDSWLLQNKGVRVVKFNYGVALTPNPVVIPHHNVYKRLAEIRKSNSSFGLLRKGTLIRICGHKAPERNCVWSVESVQNKAACIRVLLREPASVSGKEWDVILKSLMKWGVDVLPTSYVGHDVKRG